MLTTGQLTKKVGIETNTMIRWLREGILIPEPEQGRNKTFSFEEILVGRAVAPLYQEWALKSDLLREVASFVREMLSVRKDLHYTDWEALMADIALWRAKGLVTIAGQNIETREDSDAEDYMQGYIDSAEDRAKARGVTLPDNWADDSVLGPEFTDEEKQRVQRYERLIDNMFGLDRWILFVARDSEGDWSWAVADFESFRSKLQSDAASFVAVDLAKALRD